MEGISKEIRKLDADVESEIFRSIALLKMAVPYAEKYGESNKGESEEEKTEALLNISWALDEIKIKLESVLRSRGVM
jgi:hypothetical protein